MGFWLLGFLLGFQSPIEMGANPGWGVKFPKVPRARSGIQNCNFLGMGFWLLGFLLVFQPPVGMGSSLGSGVIFHKVPGRMGSPGTLPKPRGASEHFLEYKRSLS